MAATQAALLPFAQAQSGQGYGQPVPANFLLNPPPPPPPISDWRALPGRSTIDLTIPGPPAVTLRGYLYEGKDPNGPIILFFNRQNAILEDQDGFFRRLAALGPTVVAYDYRGYGFSNGHPDLATYREDALRLYDNLPDLRYGHAVLMYGFSMGAALAAYVADQRPVAGVILAAPIASAAEELRVYADLLGNPFRSMTPSAEAASLLDVKSLTAQSRAPLLVIHSRDDRIVPISQGREVFAASGSPVKSFLELPSTRHGETAAAPAALRAVKAFLTTLPAAPQP